ncbi:hypothetical protein GE061_012764 [Apolygus lucorum]|uniref:Uncharacterized protein n=1 Tax=Apolygus lucorum TaxID=248454 RepID=A0A8S9XTH0_APOLU|nr:hypothetical protein GE061_012764 [Apolygus lucorum]
MIHRQEGARTPRKARRRMQARSNPKQQHNRDTTQNRVSVLTQNYLDYRKEVWLSFLYYGKAFVSSEAEWSNLSSGSALTRRTAELSRSCIET